jgi:nitrogen fixation protein FixH
MTEKRDSLWIPWLLAGLFPPVIAVNALLVVLALRSNTGLVSDNAFDTGQSYNRIIAAGLKQAALGWRVTARLQGGAGDARLQVTVRDADGAPLRGLTISGRLYSPVAPQPDQKIVLQEQVGGLYGQSLVLPRGGQWDAQLVALRDGTSYAIDQRLILE